jgi:hypothetical protein
VIHEFCFKHQVLRPAGDQCGRCAADQSPTTYRGTPIIAAAPPRVYQACPLHQTQYEVGSRCCQCDATAETSIPQQRDTINVLEARIADLEDRCLSYARQMSVLQQQLADVQRAHNALAQASGRWEMRTDQAHESASLLHKLFVQLERSVDERIQSLTAHVQPNPDLLP